MSGVSYWANCEMSERKRNSLVCSSISKIQKKENKFDGVNKSEVSPILFTKSEKNNNHFANINHKNSSGSNNWLKFIELSHQKKESQPNKKSSINKPLQSTNVVNNKTNAPINKPNNVLRLKKNKNKDQKMVNNPTVSSIVKISRSKELNIKTVSDKDRPTAKEPVLTKQIAMDCEMVGVEIGANKSMLARISLVNAHGDCVYDKYVKPTEPVLDYRTRFSGIRPKDLENATDFKTVQKEVADMIKGRILVGHALKNDLNVLYLSHPKYLTRDTSKFKKFREGKTPALKKLAKKYLGVSIQEGEHSSAQDALAAMQLYKMFKKEWESSINSKKKKFEKCDKGALIMLPQSLKDV